MDRWLRNSIEAVVSLCVGREATQLPTQEFLQLHSNSAPCHVAQLLVMWPTYYYCTCSTLYHMRKVWLRKPLLNRQGMNLWQLYHRLVKGRAYANSSSNMKFVCLSLPGMCVVYVQWTHPLVGLIAGYM